MIITVVCTDVRAVAGDSERCVIVASQDEPAAHEPTDIKAIVQSGALKKELSRRGFQLGGALSAPAAPAKRAIAGALQPPVAVFAFDDSGDEHQWNADKLDSYQISTGSTLHYLYLDTPVAENAWLIGRTLQLKDASSSDAGAVSVSAEESSVVSSVASEIIDALQSHPRGMRVQEIKAFFSERYSGALIQRALQVLANSESLSRQKIVKIEDEAGDRFGLIAS